MHNCTHKTRQDNNGLIWMSLMSADWLQSKCSSHYCINRHRHTRIVLVRSRIWEGCSAPARGGNSMLQQRNATHPEKKWRKSVTYLLICCFADFGIEIGIGIDENCCEFWEKWKTSRTTIIININIADFFLIFFFFYVSDVYVCCSAKWKTSLFLHTKRLWLIWLIGQEV